MKYRKVEVSTSAQGSDHITALLEEFNIFETIVESENTARDILNKKADFEWDYVDEKAFKSNLKGDDQEKIIFYIECSSQGNELFEEITSKIESLRESQARDAFDLNLGSLSMEFTIEDDEDWIRAYKETLKPILLTQEIVVKPSWIDGDEFKDKTVISLDPGMAFGTGDHDTTVMCGILMEKYGCREKKILDVGTGSGILAIIGAKLGAKEVKAIDIDEVAVEVAKENVILNFCEDTVEVFSGDLTKGLEYKADIIVANLMAELVVFLSEAVKNHMEENAVFISSGILLEKEDFVKQGLVSNGLEIIEIIHQGEWCAIVAKRFKQKNI